MIASDYMGKKIRLTRKFDQRGNKFAVDCVMRVIGFSDGHPIPMSVLLKDPRRPDIRLILGESELKYMQIVHDEGRCYNCAKDVVSKDGKTCPECGKEMWELMAKQAKDSTEKKSCRRSY